MIASVKGESSLTVDEQVRLNKKKHSVKNGSYGKVSGLTVDEEVKLR